jgi:hypothetical protein
MTKTSSGGIGGSGLFGFVGTTVVCNATDTSWYCSLMKFVNVAVIFLCIFLILFYLISFLYSYYGKKRK